MEMRDIPFFLLVFCYFVIKTCILSVSGSKKQVNCSKKRNALFVGVGQIGKPLLAGCCVLFGILAISAHALESLIDHSITAVSGTELSSSIILAAGPTKAGSSSKRTVSKTITKVDSAPLQYKPFNQVKMNISAPGSARVNKPFIVVFRFASPVEGFSKGQVRVTGGKITYFAGNSYSTIFRALVLADKGLDASSRPVVAVSSSSLTGLSNKSIKILPAVKKAEPVIPKIIDLEPHLYGHLLLSSGGDSVDSDSAHHIGDTQGFQIGGSYPLPKTNTQLDVFIPRGSVRFMAGVEQIEEGTTSDGNYLKFSITTLDLLYDIKFSANVNVLGGLAVGLGGQLEAQKLSLRDLSGSHDGEIEFEDSYGFKLMLEYVAFKTETIQFYIDAGFTVLDYIPKKIILKNGSSTTLNSPTRVGASAFKLNFGILI